MYIRLVNKPDVICPWDFHIDYIGYVGAVVTEKMSLVKTQTENNTVVWVERFSLQISKKNHGDLERQGKVFVLEENIFSLMS